MTKEMLKVKEIRIEANTIFDMVEDIMVYLEGRDEDKCEMSQQHIGVDQLFRGFVAKDWKGADFHCEKYRMLNRILACYSVCYCKECWKHRNEACHYSTKQRDRILEWHNKIKDHTKKK